MSIPALTGTAIGITLWITLFSAAMSMALKTFWKEPKLARQGISVFLALVLVTRIMLWTDDDSPQNLAYMLAGFPFSAFVVFLGYIGFNNSPLRDKGGLVISVIAAFAVGLFILGPIVIINLINFDGATTQGRTTKAQADVSNLALALEQYSMDMFDYPDERDGLEALVRAPSSLPDGARYRPDGYIAKLPKDPWGRDYVYMRPGERSGRAFDLYSLGADGRRGGTGLDADIGNW